MYYLVEVGDLIRKFHIPQNEAETVGWTKLQILARHIIKSDAPPSDVHELLALASSTKALDFRARLRQATRAATKGVQFNLTAKEAAELTKALLAYGAKQTRRGMVKREAALLRLLRAAMERLNGLST